MLSDAEENILSNFVLICLSIGACSTSRGDIPWIAYAPSQLVLRVGWMYSLRSGRLAPSTAETCRTSSSLSRPVVSVSNTTMRSSGRPWARYSAVFRVAWERVCVCPACAGMIRMHVDERR
ncbi:hypothetical protein BPSG_3026 [Bifidobacterium pseudolongum subsp. globosum]|nr:hypothetical protein BPSG_3026 [Bifidobacterium pseudolongum subsp. globosum]